MFICLCVQKLGPPSAADAAELYTFAAPHAWRQLSGLGGLDAAAAAAAGGGGAAAAAAGAQPLLLHAAPQKAAEFERIIKFNNQLVAVFFYFFICLFCLFVYFVYLFILLVCFFVLFICVVD